MRAALAGNPNSGKTTLFNALTGMNQYVGNWPGVTVEKKEGKMLSDKTITLTDLPGIYSLSPYTNEEIVARDYLVNERPDVIINIIDATNLERNLYLSTQLKETGIPMILALNMMDVVRKNGDFICLKSLTEALGCPCVEISALKGEGLRELVNALYDIASKPQPKRQIFSQDVENAIGSVESLDISFPQKDSERFYAVRLLEGDEKLGFDIPQRALVQITKIRKDLENKMGDDIESIFAAGRYDYIASSIKSCKVRGKDRDIQKKIDSVVMNKYLALPIFAAVMFVVYYISITAVGSPVADWINDVLIGEKILPFTRQALTGIGTADWLVSLLTDGIIAGVGSVLSFLPQLALLFLLLSLLEDSGYMARIAFLLDKLFRRFGLSGKSFIPLIIGTGCSVPGIMASRTIESESDRKMTVITTSFIPCSAKIPIIGMIAGAFFDNAWWVATSAYFVGVLSIVISGIILKKLKAFAGDAAPFVMELPPYHAPAAGNVLRATWERGWSFIKRAFTVILLSTVIIWFLQSFGSENGAFGMVEDNNNSILAAVGGAIAFIFAPLGFGTWQATVGAVGGLVAKENLVAIMGVCYGFAEVAEAGDEMWGILAADYSAIAGYSFMVFNLLCAPCFAAMGAIKREMNSPKWTLAAIGYMCGFAYCVSMIIYQLGGLALGMVSFNFWTVVAVALLAVILYFLFRRNPYGEYGERLKGRKAAANV